MGRRSRPHRHHHSHSHGGGGKAKCSFNDLLAHFCRPIDPSRLQPRTRHAVAGVLLLLAIVLFGLGIGIVYMARSGHLGSCCFPAGCDATALGPSRLPVANINGICLFSSSDASRISCPTAEWSNLNSRCQLDNPDRCTNPQLSRLTSSVPGFAFTTGILLLICAAVIGGLCNACSTDMRFIVLTLFVSVVLLLALAATLISLLSGWNGNSLYVTSTLYFDRLGNTEAKFVKKPAISSTTSSASCPFSNARLLLWNTEGDAALGLLGTAVALAALLIMSVLAIVAEAGRCTGSCGGDDEVGGAGETTGAPVTPQTAPAIGVPTTTTLAAPILLTHPTFVEDDERPWYEKQSHPRSLDQTTITLTPGKAAGSEENQGLRKTDSILLSFPSRTLQQQGSRDQQAPNSTQGTTASSAPTARSTDYPPLRFHSTWDEPSYSPSHGNWDTNDF
jgi:hypothetical protein